MRKSQSGQGDVLNERPPGVRTSCRPTAFIVLQETSQHPLYENEGVGGVLSDLAKDPSGGVGSEGYSNPSLTLESGEHLTLCAYGVPDASHRASNAPGWGWSREGI